MCYICRQPITDYSHFSRVDSPEQEKSGKVECSLFSSSKTIHKRDLKLGKIEAEEEWNQFNET